MFVPLVLVFVAVLGAVVSIALEGPVLSDMLLLSGVSGIAALILLLRSWLARPRNWIVLDGSNIMYWEGETPQLQTVRAVAGWLQRRGHDPVIWFDANVGYLVDNRYLGPKALARRLGVTADRVFVAPKGTPADPLLLGAAVRRKARVVTNDRYRDWAGDFPQILTDGFLVAPTAREGLLELKL